MTRVRGGVTRAHHSGTHFINLILSDHLVQKVDNTIQQINLYPGDNAVGFSINYPLDSELSGG